MNRDEGEEEVENAIAALYVAFFRLRKNKRYQFEYDSMGTLISMLEKDREHMRKTFGIEP